MCIRDSGNIQTTNAVDFIVVDFWEDDLLTDTHAVVTTTVERLSGQATEVTDTRYSNSDQALKELPHAFATQDVYKRQLLYGPLCTPTI